MTKASKTKDEAAKAVSDTVAKMQQVGLSSMQGMGADWLERMSDLGSEYLDFLAERVHDDVQFQHKVLRCRDVNELHQLQAEFAQRMINRYLEETGKIIEMSTRIWSAPFKQA